MSFCLDSHPFVFDVGFTMYQWYDLGQRGLICPRWIWCLFHRLRKEKMMESSYRSDSIQQVLSMASLCSLPSPRSPGITAPEEQEHHTQLWCSLVSVGPVWADQNRASDVWVSVESLRKRTKRKAYFLDPRGMETRSILWGQMDTSAFFAFTSRCVSLLVLLLNNFSFATKGAWLGRLASIPKRAQRVHYSQLSYRESQPVSLQ